MLPPACHLALSSAPADAWRWPFSPRRLLRPRQQRPLSPQASNQPQYDAGGLSECLHRCRCQDLRSVTLRPQRWLATASAPLSRILMTVLSYSGGSYFGECWSSTTAISNASSVLPASRCGFPCKGESRRGSPSRLGSLTSFTLLTGNPLEWCGGSAALSVYTLTPAVASITPVQARVASASTTTKAALNNARTVSTTTTKAALRAARTIPARIKAKRNQVQLRKREF
jgi:hypothetical protein